MHLRGILYYLYRKNLDFPQKFKENDDPVGNEISMFSTVGFIKKREKWNVRDLN